MPTRRSVLKAVVLALAAAAPGSAQEAEESAHAFLTRIYNTYVGRDAKGMPLTERATMRLFTPRLRRLIAADAAQAAKRGEVPNLNGDPFIDAQDWEIQDFTIDTREISPGKVKATVRFKNLDKDVAMVLDLRKTKDSWQIDEIVGPSGSLHKLLTGQ
jgi:hypothetical protein